MSNPRGRPIAHYDAGGATTAQGLPAAAPAGGYTPGPESSAAGTWGAAAETGGIPGDTSSSPVGAPPAWAGPSTAGDYVAPAAALPAAAPDVYATPAAPQGGGGGTLPPVAAWSGGGGGNGSSGNAVLGGGAGGSGMPYAFRRGGHVQPEAALPEGYISDLGAPSPNHNHQEDPYQARASRPGRSAELIGTSGSLGGQATPDKPSQGSWNGGLDSLPATAPGGFQGEGGSESGPAVGAAEGGAIPDAADIPIDQDQGQEGQAGDPIQQSLQGVKSVLSTMRQQAGLTDSAFSMASQQIAGNMPAKPAGPGGDQPNTNPFPTKNGGFGQKTSQNDDDEVSAEAGGAIPTYDTGGGVQTPVPKTYTEAPSDIQGTPEWDLQNANAEDQLADAALKRKKAGFVGGDYK